MHYSDSENEFVIFLSHAKEDKPAVRELAKQLRKDSFRPWLDEDEILPGQDWELEIEKALRNSGVLLLCFSEKSDAKEGYIQKEFRRAMSLQEAMPEGEIFVIPVRLDSCEMPSFIRKLQWVDYPTEYDKLVHSLHTRQNKLSKNSQTTSTIGPTNAMVIAPEIISKAIREIEKKKNDMPQMRPGYNLGEEKALKEIGPSLCGTRAIAQFYEHGVIVCHVSGKHAIKAFAVYGGIGGHYQNMLNNNWKHLGLPITDENEAAPSPYQNNKGESSKGRYNLFEKGEIVWCWLGELRDQLYVITDPIRKFYDSLGGTGSYLGFPLANTYIANEGERSDFEDGSIVSLGPNRGTHVVRQLLRINYSDSPFNHDWKQYSGPQDLDCAAARLDTTLGKKMNMIAFNFPWENRAIRYPAERFPDGTLRFRYCGLTVKSLSPYDRFRFYIRKKTNKEKTQYLDFETDRKEYNYSEDKADAVDYWQIPLPSESNDGDWHTFVIDLQQSSQEGFTTRFEWLKGFHFRGHIGIADLMVSDSREAIEAVSINPVFVE